MKKSIQCFKNSALLASMLLLAGCAETVKQRSEPVYEGHVLLIPGRQLNIIDQSSGAISGDLPQDRMLAMQLKSWARHTLRSDDTGGPDNVLSFVIEDASLSRMDPPTQRWTLDPGPSKYTINYAVRLASKQAVPGGKELGHVEVKVEEIRYVPHGASEYRRTSELEDGISASLGKLDRELTQKAKTYLGAK